MIPGSPDTMRKSLFVYGYLEKGINHMEILSMQFLMALGTIVLMDLLLGGDNAVVIAMAANKLPENLRKKAILIGTAGAVIIRLVMTLVAVWLLTIPYLQAIGGLILLSLGVIGEYIGKIYMETKHRPRFLVERFLDEEHGFSTKPEKKPREQISES